MSPVPEEDSIDSASRPGQSPGALAILTATALGSVVAARLPKAPLVFAAGAAALALLKQKKGPATPVRRLPVFHQTEDAALPGPPHQDKVRQWLDEQVHRESMDGSARQHACDTSLSPAVDEYTPPAFLLDDDNGDSQPLCSDFASLTEPVSRLTSPTPADARPEPDLPAPRMIESVESCIAPNSGWLLGIDPLPSIGESPAPPVFNAPVFEGGALPDEIEVPQPPDPEPVVHLAPSVPETAGVIESPVLTTHSTDMQANGIPAQDIEVQIAAPGEASFDPPLAGMPPNPWLSPETPLDSSLTALTSPPAPSPPGPVVEAEIILRPRAPTQTSVTAKSRPLLPRFAPVSSTPPPDGLAADGSAPAALPPAPQVTPREQRARPTWRSWWRGD